MSWLDQLTGVLQQYSGMGPGQQSDTAHDDFDQLAQRAPQPALASGISEAFRSEQTPPFPQMLSQLFGSSPPGQQANLLNTLIAAAGPTIASQVLSRTGISGLGGLIGGGPPQITPDQARMVPADAVQQMADYAERQDPSIIDHLSNFYAQHPQLVKSLGSAALTIAISRIAQQQFGRSASR